MTWSLGRDSRIGFSVSPRRNPGLSVGRTAIIKLAVAVRALTFVGRVLPEERRALRDLKLMRNCFRGRQAVIYAGGPSAPSLDSAEVAKLQDRGLLHVFAINRFNSSEIGKTLHPDFYVLGDPAFGPGGRLRAVASQLLTQYPEAKLFLPVDWRFRNQVPSYPDSQRIKRFEFRSLEGWGQGITPVKLRRYTGLTALSAMAIASYLGYDRIGLIGLDATIVFKMRVDRENRIFLDSNHHQGAEGEETNLATRHLAPSGKYAGHYRNSSDLFFGEATLHDHLDRFFSPEGRFVNLSNTSVVTSFPREHPSDFLSKVGTIG